MKEIWYIKKLREVSYYTGNYRDNFWSDSFRDIQEYNSKEEILKMLTEEMKKEDDQTYYWGGDKLEICSYIKITE